MFNKMKIYNRLQIIALSLLLVACERNVKTVTDIPQVLLPWNIDNARTIDDLVESVNVIPLDSSVDNSLGYVNAMKMDEDGIYISDRRNQTLLAFNHDGSVKCQYGRIGRAVNSGEYINYRAYCVDSSRLYMVDNAVKKLFTYDKQSGKFISSQDMPFYAYDMEVLPNGNFVFVWCRHLNDGSIDNSASIYKLTVTDSNLDVKEEYLQPTDNDGYEEKSVYLTKLEDGFSYHYFFTDTILVFDSNLKNPKQYIMPVDNTIPDGAKIDTDIYDEKRVADGYNFFNGMNSPIVTSKYIVFNLHGISNYGTFAYDIESKSYVLNKKDHAIRFMFEPMCYYDNYIYSCVSRYNYNEAVNKGFEPSDGFKLETTNENTEFFIVKYKMKSV